MKNCKNFIMVFGLLGCMQNLQAMKGEMSGLAAKPLVAPKLSMEYAHLSPFIESNAAGRQNPVRINSTGFHDIVSNHLIQMKPQIRETSVAELSVPVFNSFLSNQNNFKPSGSNLVRIPKLRQIQKQEPVLAPLLLTYDPNFKNQEPMQEKQQVQPELNNQPALTKSQMYDQSVSDYYTGAKKFAAPSQLSAHNYIQFESPQSLWQGQSNSGQESITFPTENIAPIQINQTPVELSPIVKVHSDNPLMSRPVIQSGKRKLPTRQKMQEGPVDLTQVVRAPELVTPEELVVEPKTQEVAVLINTLLQNNEVQKGLSPRSTLQVIIDTLRYIKDSFFEMIGFKPSLAENQKVETQLVPIAQDLKNNKIDGSTAAAEVTSVVISAAINNSQNSGSTD